MSGDVIIIGAGHNGLTAAARLAGAGKKVTVCEKRAVPGGLAAAVEFHDGYTAPGILHDTGGIRSSMVDSLSLEKFGLRYAEPAGVFAAGPGETVYLPGDRSKRAEALASHSGKDAAGYAAYARFIDDVESFIRPLMSSAPPPLIGEGTSGLWELIKAGAGFRRLGRERMLEFLRIGPLPVADWMRELFETPALQALVAGPATDGTLLGPLSPGTAANLILHECTRGKPVDGGPAVLIDALVAACKSAGVEIRLESAVESLLFEDGSVRGVRLAGGEELRASVVASSCDPKTTFLRFVPPRELSLALERTFTDYRARGVAAKIHLALSGEVEFAGADGRSIVAARIADDLGDMERSFDNVKYERLPERPYLDVRVPSIATPQLAPDGHHVVSIIAYGVPTELRGGWSDEAREQLGDAVIGRLEEAAPGVRDRIVARQVLTPADIAREYGAWGGHLLHGEHSLDQLLFMRPVPECARYSTPLKGLYLCGSGTHPDGAVTCAPGFLAANAILS